MFYTCSKTRITFENTLFIVSRSSAGEIWDIMFWLLSFRLTSVREILLYILSFHTHARKKCTGSGLEKKGAVISCLLLSPTSSVRTHRTACAVSCCVLLLEKFMLYVLPPSDKRSTMVSVYMWHISEHLCSQKNGINNFNCTHSTPHTKHITQWHFEVEHGIFCGYKSLILRVSLSTEMKAGFIVKYNWREISISRESVRVPVHKIHLPQELHLAYMSYETRNLRASFCCDDQNGPDALYARMCVGGLLSELRYIE